MLILRNLYIKLRFYILLLINETLFNMLILSDEHTPILERIYSFIKLISMSAPIAFILNMMGSWFTDNREFSTYVIGCIILNMVAGCIRHFRTVEFSWITLLIKTGIMLLVLVLVYAGLEMMLKVARENVVTEVFRIALQVSTLMYPVSKMGKSIFIITKGEYPPEWLMRKFYNFNKTGDLNNLFNKQEINKEDGE